MTAFTGVGWRWALGLSLLVLVGFHLSASQIDFTAASWAWLDRTSHTPTSIWIRIGSLPLRLTLLGVLAVSLYRFRPAYAFPVSLPGVLLQIWTASCGYYIADLLLSTAAVSHFLTVTALCLTAACMLLALLLPDKGYLPASALMAALIALVHVAQQQSGENNAFTLFGLQGLALIAATRRPALAPRLLLGVILIPAFGYLFPVAEKLMLNPLGWLGGSTFQAFAGILGYPLSYPVSLVGSWLLLLFQASFLLVLARPERASYLYPAAILFHLSAGLILGFGTVLNPWILSLCLSWAALRAGENTLYT